MGIDAKMVEAVREAKEALQEADVREDPQAIVRLAETIYRDRKKQENDHFNFFTYWY